MRMQNSPVITNARAEREPASKCYVIITAQAALSPPGISVAMVYLVNDLLGNPEMTPGCIDKFAFLVIIRGTCQPPLPSATGTVFAPHAEPLSHNGLATLLKLSRQERRI